MMEKSASGLLEELKAFLYPYIVIGPLIAALFAKSIDSFFAACIMFVAFVGTAFFWFSRRIQLIEDAVQEMEHKLKELETHADIVP